MKAMNWVLRGLALAIVLNVGVALPAYAQLADGQKIAVINGDRVLMESSIGIQVQQEAQTAANDWDNRIGAKQVEIDTLIAQAEEQRLTLTAEALARIQSNVEQSQVDLQRLQDDAQRALNRMAEQAQTRINERLIPAVEQLAAEAGYDLILDTRMQGILYFATSIDATDRYIALVNANNPPPQQESHR
ncbi:uncharacterized protein METZ01_LOCUS127653 [marine metagenome]|uniref:OmpH family outer membrane protein n=1 Tax=marine metagenome TaxID=408172 RepID=A0A381YCJ1_9ZZZZ|tara:strand:- start:151 stop:717 length:567 start_codon:yes stop_codon:yes gene_type:complete